MNNFFEQNLKNFNLLSSEQIIAISEDEIINSSFKLNLEKDKLKGIKISNQSFYGNFGNVLIKIIFNNQTGRIAIFVSKDVEKSFENFINFVENLPIEKIDYYLNDSFVNLINLLKKHNYSVDVVRKQRFLNKNIYQNEIIMGKHRGV